MKNLFIFSMSLITAWAYADHPALSHCGATDAKCVGEVLLKAIGTSSPTIEFYWDDKCQKNFLAAVRQGDKQACRDKSFSVYHDVNGIKMNGTCLDIEDKGFLAACVSVV